MLWWVFIQNVHIGDLLCLIEYWLFRLFNPYQIYSEEINDQNQLIFRYGAQQTHYHECYYHLNPKSIYYAALMNGKSKGAFIWNILLKHMKSLYSVFLY